MNIVNPVPYIFSQGKTPNERRQFSFDFSTAPEFARGVNMQTVTSYTVTCTNNDGQLVVEAPSLSGNESNPTIVSAYISGGTAGVTYDVLYHVVTSANAIIERTVLLPVLAL